MTLRQSLFPFFFLLLTIPARLFAQQKDTIVACIAKWHKGEKKELVITRTKERWENGQPTKPFNFTYLANILVLDSTSNGYTIQWTLNLTEETKNESPGIEKLMPVYNGLKMIFTTDNDGMFEKLNNWEEVRDAFVDMAMFSFPKDPTKDAAEAMEKAKAMFNSQQMVEATCIKEIQLYHAAYGGEFSTVETATPTLIANPFGGEPMSAVILQKAKNVDRVKKTFTAIVTQKLDTSGTRILMTSMFKALDIPLSTMDSVNKHTNETLSKFRIEDNSEYQVDLATGWITAIKYERIGITGELKQTETFVVRSK